VFATRRGFASSTSAARSRTPGVAVLPFRHRPQHQHDHDADAACRQYRADERAEHFRHRTVAVRAHTHESEADQAAEDTGEHNRNKREEKRRGRRQAPGEDHLGLTIGLLRHSPAVDVIVALGHGSECYGREAGNDQVAR
jgi:hypothetical protein